MTESERKVSDFLQLVGGITEDHIDNLTNLVKNYVKENGIEVKPFPIKPAENPLLVDKNKLLQSRVNYIMKLCANTNKNALIFIEGFSPCYSLAGKNPYKGQPMASAKALHDLINEARRDDSDNLHMIEQLISLIRVND